MQLDLVRRGYVNFFSDDPIRHAAYNVAHLHPNPTPTPTPNPTPNPNPNPRRDNVRVAP